MNRQIAGRMNRSRVFALALLVFLFFAPALLLSSCASREYPSIIEPSFVPQPTASFQPCIPSPTPTSTLQPEEEALGIPILSEEKYLEYINDSIQSFSDENNLYLIRRDFRSPYFTYYFRPGSDNADGTYSAVSLTLEDHEALFSKFKQFLLFTIGEKALEHGDGFFSRPRTQIVGFSLSNQFFDRNTGRATELYIADFQIDLMDYYYQDSSDDYIDLESFDSSRWDHYDTSQ